jgi:MurNAc alpha-1-phosphate uridylyltransferase
MPDAAKALMLFAAGVGARMGPLVADRPKPMIKVAGRPLIDHALRQVRQAGIGRVVVNSHYLAHAISDHLSGSGVEISHEHARLLDTGGGLKFALPLLGRAPVFTLNCDAVWAGDNPLLTLQAAWDASRMDALLLLVERENATGHTGPGDFHRTDDGHLSRGPGYVYTGAQILKTGLLDEVRESAFSLNLIWDMMQSRGRLFGVIHQGAWCDVGRPESIRAAENMLAKSRDV